MALTKFGFIVSGAGLNPDLHRMEMTSSNFQMIAIGVTDIADAPSVARTLVAEGVQLIELCGGFGPLGAARVLDAVNQSIPVGVVGYGPESLRGLHNLFASAK